LIDGVAEQGANALANAETVEVEPVTAAERIAVVPAGARAESEGEGE
jgi:hypothetical protein